MKTERIMISLGALFGLVVLLVTCEPNSLLSDVQQKVTLAKESSTKAITSFAIVSPPATGAISGTSVAITVPYKTNVTALVATFTETGVSVEVGSTVQNSGVTANDFTKPVTYIVTAADGSTQSYVVTVTVLSFGSYTTANNLGSNFVNAVIGGSYIYAATSNGMSISINGGATWSTYTQQTNGLGNNQVMGVALNGSTIYAATYGGGLSVSTNGGTSWPTPYTYPTSAGFGSSLMSNYVMHVYVLSSKVYVSTWGGLSILNGSTWTNYTAAQGLGSNSVYSVAVSGSTIYAATVGGLSIYNGTSWTNFTTANGLASNQVMGVAVTGSAIYAATSGGLSVSTTGGVSWTNYTTANGLGGNTVTDVAVTYNVNNNGLIIRTNVFAATSGGLSVSHDGGATWTNYTTASGLAGNMVNGLSAIATGISSGLIYAATNGGVSVGNGW